MTPLLEINDLEISFAVRGRRVEVVQGISLTLEEGRVLGIVGESGSGKSVSMLAVLSLLPSSATVSGSVRFRGRELLGMNAKALREIRGGRIGMIFQDSLTALNPVLTIGDQLSEAVRLHDRGLSRGAARNRATDLLDLVSIPGPAKRLDSYPHEFSGGMRQRVVIAMAVANEPDLVIADEPTTALDVTVQAQILEVLDRLRERFGLALILITHDLGVVAGTAHDVAVMYAGRVVEKGAVDDVYYRSRHPYTQGLLASLPNLEGARGEKLLPIRGAPPVLAARPAGCAFHPRCSAAVERCSVETPLLRPAGPGWSACHLADRLGEGA